MDGQAIWNARVANKFFGSVANDNGRQFDLFLFSKVVIIPLMGYSQWWRTWYPR